MYVFFGFVFVAVLKNEYFKTIAEKLVIRFDLKELE